MTSYRSPGHATCFFSPCRTEDINTTGSTGVGIRLSLGSEVSLEERSDSAVNIFINGVISNAPISRKLLSIAVPNRGFDVYVNSSLPSGQGFGMSASGAVALAFCVSSLLDKNEDYAYRLAHRVEVLCGGGLGDVSGIRCEAHVPIRKTPGIDGIVKSAGLKFDCLSLVVLGGEIKTASIIENSTMSDKISIQGEKSIMEFLKNPSMEMLFSTSRNFSKTTGLESKEMSVALDKLDNHGAMCMLGNSIFSDLSKDEICEILGDVIVYSCKSTDKKITRIK